MCKRKGQAVTEYLLVFVALAVLSLWFLNPLDANSFLGKVRQTGEDLFIAAAERIAK